jgi:hypothetical protein
VTTAIDPVKLAGLKQATYVMQCLVKGHSEEQIAIALNGDKQLVTMWVSFLRHNHWMTEESGKWTITAKGENWNKA